MLGFVTSTLHRLALKERNSGITFDASSATPQDTQNVPRRSAVLPKPDMPQFIRHLVQLVFKEQEINRKEIRAMFEGSPKELEKKGVAILNLVVTDVKKGVAGKSTLTLSLPRNSRDQQVLLPTHKLKTGEAVSLKQYSVYSSIERDDDVEWACIITAVKKFHIVIALVQVQFETMMSLPIELQRSCQITKSNNNVTYTRMLETLSVLINMVNTTQNPLILGLLGQRNLAHRENDEVLIDYFDENLNVYQKDAVKFSLGSSVISLIHGPPGKTHTLVEIIQQLAVVQKKRVLVCAPSNIAVDNLAERVIKLQGIKVIRIGHPAKVIKSVVPYTLDVLSCPPGSDVGRTYQIELEELRQKHRQATDELQRRTIDRRINVLNRALMKATSISVEQVMKDVNVTFSTLIGSNGHHMKNRLFDVVIIDEAGQATEPECWIPVLKCTKVILAGDHLQLPPTVKTLPAVINGEVKFAKGMSSSTHLTYTLFDRLTDMFGDDIMKMLCIQYRMHDSIMRFSSDELYEKKLIAHSTNSAHLLHDLPNIRSTLCTKSSIMVIDTSDTGRELESCGKGISKKSTANQYEAEIAIRYVKKLIQDGLTEDQIGIITPYTAQVKKILISMGDKWQNVEVGSVDGFQGREKEAVILSLVRSNRRGNVGFLAEKRRLNVAMTRAKRHLAIICDMKTLDNSKNEGGSNSTSMFDRTFLTKWMKWLDKEAVIQYSNAFNHLPL